MIVAFLRHISNYSYYSQGKQCLKSCRFRPLQKTVMVQTMTCCDRLFKTRAAATGKARSLIVDSRVRWTIIDVDEAERRRRLPAD